MAKTLCNSNSWHLSLNISCPSEHHTTSSYLSIHLAPQSTTWLPGISQSLALQSTSPLPLIYQSLPPQSTTPLPDISNLIPFRHNFHTSFNLSWPFRAPHHFLTSLDSKGTSMRQSNRQWKNSRQSRAIHSLYILLMLSLFAISFLNH